LIGQARNTPRTSSDSTSAGRLLGMAETSENIRSSLLPSFTSLSVTRSTSIAISSDPAGVGMKRSKWLAIRMSPPGAELDPAAWSTLRPLSSTVSPSSAATPSRWPCARRRRASATARS
jgi:hypothetical protein